ncbi:chemotaxis protein CheB, partial [Acinetobacter baumannii]
VRRKAPAHAAPPLAPSHAPAAPAPKPAAAAAPASLMRRAFSSQAPRALVIGSSTGGPQALMSLVTDLGPVIDRFPVLITQHMPPTFTT